ncbi:MAG: phospholipase A [Bacteroidales bacterium]|nr:phospholipase A [Bacteroidales bacterium]MDY2916518.1 phospholipase A [Muribaculaceae bacterium]
MLKKLLRKTLMLIVALVAAGAASAVHAQIVAEPGKKVDTDSIRRAFDNQPYFGIYKDNYFIFGPAIGPKITRKNTNIKFQISIAQRLTKSTLPLGTYLYLFYTQKVMWNVLEKSMPMTDLNFNPGIGLAKPLFVKNRFIGKVILCLEHESNGRDEDASRSWNKISLGANIMVDPMLMVHGKFWIPIVDGMNNKDILDYSGIYQVGLQMFSPNRRFNLGITLVKRRGWNLNYNSIIELSYRLWKRDNQFLFMQYYNGYGEDLLEYNKFHSQLRVGIVIKPRLFSDF